MTVERIKLLRNKRDAVVNQMRRDIALLLQSIEDATTRVRVRIYTVTHSLSLFLTSGECQLDLKEGIASLIFVGPRCLGIPELQTIHKIFEKKYGKDFVSALIKKISVRTPSGEIKLKIMKEIAKEYKIEWDTTETEIELLKPPEQHIDGPTGFASANNLLLKFSLLLGSRDGEGRR
ncbi:uncharacterized protein LOC124933972 [Impatiens glandulifera]|uniref:uncharacterized protein LOC124933972 n=1 Tax=Impatiens glandulifera TaxID=253017 RepID=UPI001FB10369|nr:uncharacterized protein LOC124933972 [Impatiens glandulifera]